MKWLAAIGIVTPILDVLVIGGLAALDPKYSHTRQYISELGETGRPYAAVFNAWCIVYGVLFAGFAVGLGKALRSWSGLVAILAIAGSSIVGGVFHCDPGCAGETPSAQVHYLAGDVSLAGIVSAPFFACFAMQRSGVWSGYRAFSLVCGVLLLVVAAWLGTCHYSGNSAQVACPGGAIQRLLYGIQYAWVIVIAIKLWRLADVREQSVA